MQNLALLSAENPEPIVATPQPPKYADIQGGLSEEEAIERTLRESLAESIFHDRNGRQLWEQYRDHSYNWTATEVHTPGMQRSNAVAKRQMKQPISTTSEATVHANMQGGLSGMEENGRPLEESIAEGTTPLPRNGSSNVPSSATPCRQLEEQVITNEQYI